MHDGSDAQTEIPTLAVGPKHPQRLSNERALWMLAGVGLMWWAWQLIGDSGFAWTVPFLVVSNLWGLATVIVSWLPEGVWSPDGRVIKTLEWGTVALTVAVFVAWAITSVGGMSPYGTDAMAFNQYAAQIAEHGGNPYVHSMRPAFGLFRTPTLFYTYSFAGKPVTALSYPSMSFLVYVPFLLLGWSQNLAPLINVFAWALAVLMMAVLAPRHLRPVALLLGGFGLYSVFAIGGVTDVVFIPPLLIAAYKWDKFGTARWTYIQPVMFGLAMGIKQNPWPALPFLLVALCLDEQRRTNLNAGLKRAGKYLAVTVAVLLIPNIPYFIAAPKAWINGTLTPLFANMVPTGQGSISLSLYLHMGGGSVFAFTAASVLMLALLMVLFIGTYPLLRAGAFVLPAIAFFFADRSNVNYFISLIPVGFIAAATVDQPPFRRFQRANGRRDRHGEGQPATALGGWFRSARWGVAAAVLAVLFVGTAVYSLAAPQPLRLRLTSLITTGTTSHIEQMSVAVTNNTGHSVKPAFDVMRGGYNSSFWRIASGPRSLGPGQTRTYKLQASNMGAQPSVYGGFNIVSYVQSPKAFSVSSTYHPSLYHLAFVPDAINRIIRLGKPVNVTVQVYNNSGAALHQAGIKVRLTEIYWTKLGPRKAQARINAEKKVGHFSYSLTNSQGVATFKVVGIKASTYPVTFNAALQNKRFSYVYSDSGSLIVRFGGR